MKLKDFNFGMLAATSEGLVFGLPTVSLSSGARVYGMCGSGMDCSGGNGQCGSGMNCGGEGSNGCGQCGSGMNCSGGGGECGSGMNCGGR
jgi:hypothetical protein